jgi:UDP-galactopyranose mutase
MPATTTCQLNKALRQAGFEIFYKDSDVTTWRKRIDTRRVVDVQLWHDGQHRAAHVIDGRGTTLPMDFETLEEMMAAIAHETARMDNANFTQG